MDFPCSWVSLCLGWGLKGSVLNENSILRVSMEFADWYVYRKDVSEGLFGKVAPGGDGRMKGVEWW